MKDCLSLCLSSAGLRELLQTGAECGGENLWRDRLKLFTFFLILMSTCLVGSSNFSRVLIPLCASYIIEHIHYIFSVFLSNISVMLV